MTRRVSLSALFIRRPIGTSLLAIGVLIVGSLFYLRLGVSALPVFDVPIIFVQASQAGADASTMASTVTAPLERRLGQVAGVNNISSTSSEGSSVVILEFGFNQSVDSVAQDVAAALSAASTDLPSGMSTPSYHKADPNHDPLIAIALTSETQSAAALYNLADSLLAQRLRQTEGVAQVDVAGASMPAVRVDVNLRAMNALGLSPDDLRNAMRAANVVSPTGFLSDDQGTTAIMVNDSVRKAADFANLAISSKNGVTVRLKDIANVYDGQQDAYQSAWFNKKPAVVMYVTNRSDSNAVATVDRIRAQLPLLKEYLSPGTTLTPYYDRTPTIRSSLNEVEVALLISVVMVILITALFLRRTAPTVIAAVTMPLSLAGAAVVMYALGFTLNNLSLLALVIAIGFVVDDAIVVIENIMRHLDEGMSPIQAAMTGSREIGFTIVSITVSLIAVFIPILFAPGIVGVLFREFSVTVVAAILISAVISLTLTPTLCSRFLKPHQTPAKASRLGRGIDAGHALMLRIYTTCLDFSLRHALLLSLTPLLLIVLTFVLLTKVKTTGFPEQDTGLIWGRAQSNAAVSFADMKMRQDRITTMLMEDPDVKIVGVRLGSGRQGASASFNIELKTRAEGRKKTTAEVLARLSKKADFYPDLRLRLRAVQDIDSGGGGQGAQYKKSLQGDSLQDLEYWLPKIVDELKKNPQLLDVGSDVDEGGLRQNIVIDRDKASRLGISIGAIDGALYGAFGQRSISTIYSELNQYNVVVNALPNQTATPAQLDAIKLKSSSGEMVPLSAIAYQENTLAPSQINHLNQYTVMDISYNLAPGVSTGEADKIFNSVIDGMRLPGSVKIAADKSFTADLNPNSMLVLIFAAIVVVYIVLGMLYENLVHPVTILSTLPAAGVGALAALLITDTALSAISMIALVLLIGIVKKNAIMMIDFALVAQRERNLTPLQAAREASIIRFRPIMMTTMVAILAALPIAIGMGEGSEVRQPLGIAMIGGLLISQSLTLLSTPALYVLFSCLQQHWRNWRAKARAKKQVRRLQRAARAS